jgi:RecA-family ATPase
MSLIIRKQRRIIIFKECAVILLRHLIRRGGKADEGEEVSAMSSWVFITRK